MNPGGSSTEPLSWSDPSSWDLTMHSLNHPSQPQHHHNSAPPPPAVSLSSKEWEISWQQQQPDHHHHHQHHQHHHQQQHQHNLYYPLQHHGHQASGSHELKPAALILSSHHQQSPLLPRASYSSSSSSSSPHHQALLFPPGYTTFSSASATAGGTSHHLQAMLQHQHQHQQQQQQQQQQRSHHSPATLALLHQNFATGSSILELQPDPDQEPPTYQQQQRRNYFGSPSLLDESHRTNLVGSGAAGYVNYHHAAAAQASSGSPGGAALALKREDWSLSQQEQQYHQQVAAANEWLHGRIGLNLGGRTYFSAEDSLIARFGKRPRLNGPSVHVPLCQAEGCTADLSKAKHYHRRHKVCELHSKAPNVVANGQTQRFCQQCSRFHLLTEFDDSKRSCRKRLADHNRRRRKPQPNANPATTTSSGGAGGVGKTEQSSEGGADQPEASEATHSSADTKPTPLLLKSTSSPSGSRDDKALVHTKPSGEEGAQSKQASGVQNEGSHHHNSVQSTLSSSADIPLRGGQVMSQDQLGAGVGVYSTNTGSQNYSSSNAANSGPNLSLSSSFGSSSQLLAMDQTNKNDHHHHHHHNNNNNVVNNARNNSGSQCSSIEHCSWLKSATTTTTTTTTTAATTTTTTTPGGSRTMNSLGSANNNNNCNANSNTGRPIRSHNFHDLISSHSSQQQLSTRSPVFNKALQPTSYGATTPSGRGLNGEGSYSLVGSPLGTTITATTASHATTTTEYFGISRDHGSSNSGALEDHQVLSLLESRPLGVNAGADLGFIQQLSKENHHTIHDVDEEEETDVNGARIVASQHDQQQKHSSCGEFKFQEMQSLRGFYGSTGSLL